MSTSVTPDTSITLSALRERLLGGMVIPAHPLALDSEGVLSEKHQRALARYYMDAGAGGLAVGVHTTQFEIRNPEYDLLEPVLRIAAEEARGSDCVLIAGVVGETEQAVSEARLAHGLGYDAGLLSLAAFQGASDDTMIRHCEQIAAEIPVFGFYLQPAVGGRELSREFWCRFASIENVVAIKVAPFDRYQTLDVLAGVAESGRADEIALYTGNDDHIILDLAVDHHINVGGGLQAMKFAGGLLGHWAFWTLNAVDHLRRCKASSGSISGDLLALSSRVTEANAAVFDAANGFRGCIAGINEILFRQGLLPSPRCLNPNERLSPGQAEAIDRVTTRYPDLPDDDFVARNLARWLS